MGLLSQNCANHVCPLQYHLANISLVKFLHMCGLDPTCLSLEVGPGAPWTQSQIRASALTLHSLALSGFHHTHNVSLTLGFFVV